MQDCKRGRSTSIRLWQCLRGLECIRKLSEFPLRIFKKKLFSDNFREFRLVLAKINPVKQIGRYTTNRFSKSLKKVS